jgi:hypothetical protein
MFRTRQLVLDPPTEINAASSISARGCLRLSSIYRLVHHWSQSNVKPVYVGADNGNPPDGGCRAGSRMGWTRCSAGAPQADDSTGFDVTKTVNGGVAAKKPASEGSLIPGAGDPAIGFGGWKYGSCAQAICRIRAPVTVIWFRLAVDR